MRNHDRIIYGVVITFLIFATAIFLGNKMQLVNGFFPSSFVTHSVMLILSIVFIFFLREHVSYKIALPEFKKSLRPILFGLLATIIINVLMSVLH
jgi:hypothetical protein